VHEQGSSVLKEKECCSTVHKSPPLLLAANSEAVSKNPNVSQSHPTMPNVSQSQPTTPIGIQ